MKRLLTSIKQGVKLSFLRFLSLGKQGEGGKMEGNVLKILNCADLLSRLLLTITSVTRHLWTVSMRIIFL